MINGIVIIGQSCEVLVEKYYHNKHKRKDLFPLIQMIKIGKEIPPIYSFNSIVFYSVHVNNIYIIAISSVSSDSQFVSSLLDQIVKMLEKVIKPKLEIEELKSLYVVAYVILDQFVDDGFPFIDELNVINSSVSNSETLNICTTAPWRVNQLNVSQSIETTVHEKIYSHVNANGKLDNLFVYYHIRYFSLIYLMPHLNLH